MYKNVLQAISGIEIYPLISFSIFFLFFLGLLLFVFTSRREHIAMLSQMPLNNENCADTTKEDHWS